MSIYRRVLRYYRPFLAQTVFGLCLSLVGIGLNLLKPWPFKIIVDDVVQFRLRGGGIGAGRWDEFLHSPDPRLPVVILCLVLVVIQLLWGIANWATNYILVKVG